MESGNDLGDGGDGKPTPTTIGAGAHPDLELLEFKILKEVVVTQAGKASSTIEPESNGIRMDVEEAGDGGTRETETHQFRG